MEPTKNSPISGPSSSKPAGTEPEVATASASGSVSAPALAPAIPMDHRIQRGVPVSPHKVTALITLPIIITMVIAVCVLSFSNERNLQSEAIPSTQIQENKETVSEFKQNVEKSSKKADALVEDIDDLQRVLVTQQAKKDIKVLYEGVKSILEKDDHEHMSTSPNNRREMPNLKPEGRPVDGSP